MDRLKLKIWDLVNSYFEVLSFIQFFHEVALIYFFVLTTIKNEFEQLLEMISDTRQLAGAEAYETSRFIYMKAQMAVKMKESGTQTIVDELGKLFKQQSAPPTPPTN